ncbi:hypothetical protein B4135_1340 [Caldibacillus debilis]|uniref:Uncharacterized protein n=1 Tax=Caldibacillus debilis TaxID=301148 RepID=A0A150MCX6_9BACI|nr:hypothetical protein B4135_1340 [Caldibacillus debilis]
MLKPASALVGYALISAGEIDRRKSPWVPAGVSGRDRGLFH